MYPCTPFLFLIMLFVFVASCDSQGDEYYYLACAPKRFECGDFRDNISYPFQVDEGRPGYCSNPGYHITCVNDTAQIQIGSKTYRVTDPSFNVTLCHNCLEAINDLGFKAVPCYQNEKLTINKITIVDAVKEGFQLNWLAGEAEWCQRCRGAGGLCGSDPSEPATSACF
ncbi:hypothetical protein H6P81_010461 [Aristolochia fimbriata]|uniref:Wall-associated receptor kinase galacturonan-binding domain-containing protein n=1 Tax=Aristolochia fimbriata TaxID=158543 RepID=A0AAV7ES79_ARIFI|nr:hypothetical protein H6P81_010461 [Aristolochia fimbriata]